MTRLLLPLFALTNLVIGTGAFIITSMLPAVAQALSVSVSVAGQAMSAYALSTALLSPLLLVATGRWPRRRALVFGVGLFAAGNVLCALATGMTSLLVGRVLMGMGAMFTPLAAGIVVALVPPAQRGKALAFIFLGISLSYVVGLPLGSLLADAWGWQAPIWVMVGASVLMCLLLWRLVPADVQSPGASFSGLKQVLARPDVVAVLATTMLYFTAIFLVFSYIVPVLQALVPMSSQRLSITLMLFGLSGVVGTLVGGWANDRLGSARTLGAGLLLLALMMCVLPTTASSWPLMMATLLLWGTAGFGMMAPQQSRLATLQPQQAPLLLSLNTSMLYIGTALGAVLGGAVAPVLGFAHLSWGGAPLALAALLLLWVGPRRGALAKA